MHSSRTHFFKSPWKFKNFFEKLKKCFPSTTFSDFKSLITPVSAENLEKVEKGKVLLYLESNSYTLPEVFFLNS